MRQLIHIPKTGGTSFYLFLVRWYPEHFQEFMYRGQPPHELKAAFVPHPLAIVRDPLERVLSLYRYWRSGSDMFPEPCRSNASFSSFLSEVNIFNVWKTYIGPEHLLPQTYWVSPESYGKTILVRYESDLGRAAKSLLSHLGLPDPMEPLPRANVTIDQDPVEVSDSDMETILQRYGTDFILWDQANEHPELFEKVI